MISVANIIRMPLVRLLLLLGFLSALHTGGDVSAEEKMTVTSKGIPCEIEPGQSAAHAEQDAARNSRLVTGDVMQMNGKNVVVKDKNEKEVRFQLTKTTEKPPIQKGDRISVSLDSQNRALWIRGNRATDRRAEHVSADCNPTEEVSSEALKQFGKTSE